MADGIGSRFWPMSTPQIAAIMDQIEPNMFTDQEQEKDERIVPAVSKDICFGCMVRMPKQKQVVIQGLKDCIVAEYYDVLLICQLSEEQRIKEWYD